MKAVIRTSAVTLALLLIALLHTWATARGKAAPPYTLRQAQQYIAELAPLVEKAARRKFQRIPKCKLVVLRAAGSGA